MHQKKLLNLLNQYSPFDAQEEADWQRIIQFVQEEPRCLDRRLQVGHVTASAWIVNLRKSHTLLTLHKKLGIWLQLGGHIENETDVLQAALREAKEESGISHIQPLSLTIFQVAVHEIPPFQTEPAHVHYDITFLFQATDERYVLSDESLALRWFTRKEVRRLPLDTAMQRLVKKWDALAN